MIKITITDSAKEALHTVNHDHMIQLSLDKGDCDIVNNIYEMKIIPKRAAGSFEKIESAGEFTFLIDENFEDLYSDDVMIDYGGGHFIFKNKNQIFNSNVKLTRTN